MAADSKYDDLGYLEGGRGWGQLEELIQLKRDSIEKRLLADLLNAKEPLDARYDKGFLDALTWVLKRPEWARKRHTNEGAA